MASWVPESRARLPNWLRVGCVRAGPEAAPSAPHRDAETRNAANPPRLFGWAFFFSFSFLLGHILSCLLETCRRRRQRRVLLIPRLLQLVRQSMLLEALTLPVGVVTAPSQLEPESFCS